MTAGEACVVLADTVCELSATRADRDGWRLLALVAMQKVADLTRELEMVDARQYVHRTRTQDERDVFLDQRDLRSGSYRYEPGSEAA